jgi:zinc/manganese transport system ATP-binding protein
MAHVRAANREKHRYETRKNFVAASPCRSGSEIGRGMPCRCRALAWFFVGNNQIWCSMSAALVFKNLTLGYDQLPAVQQLDTEIQEGSLTAIVGPNGAGKSTLLKGVTGALSPLEGQVHIDGFRDEEIAYLPQQSEIDRSFPICVVDLVAMGLWHKIGAFGRLRPAMPARLDAAIAAVGLTGFEKRSIGSLSGGQMQRALFARLLLQDARLVLLDEPFAAIDSKTMTDLINLIKDWHSEGRTVLAVLHDNNTVGAHFPQTMMLARELVAHGPTAKVLTSENQFRARQMCEACAGTPHVCGKTAA